MRPVAGRAGATAAVTALGTARGSFLRSWRLLVIDGFEADVPDSDQNAAGFRRRARSVPPLKARPTTGHA